MNLIFLSLLVALIAWIVSYEVFYSPKALIKKLWVEISRLEGVTNKFHCDDSVADSLLLEPFEKQIGKKIQIHLFNKRN